MKIIDTSIVFEPNEYGTYAYYIKLKICFLCFEYWVYLRERYERRDDFGGRPRGPIIKPVFGNEKLAQKFANCYKDGVISTNIFGLKKY